MAGFEDTVTWRVSTFLLLFLALSVVLEKILHRLHQYFHHHHLIGFMYALDKLKDELML